MPRKNRKKGMDTVKLYDENDRKELTLLDLFRDWKRLRKDEPWNCQESFRDELHEILMATINGRNDLDVIGMTPAETSRYILRIRTF